MDVWCAYVVLGWLAMALGRDMPPPMSRGHPLLDHCQLLYLY